MNDGVKSSENLAQFRVKVIFDTVITFPWNFISY